MNKTTTIKSLIFIILAGFYSCSTSVETEISFQNLASNKVYVNFRAELIPVESGQIVKITDLPKGSYEYDTIYEIPAGVTSAVAEGDVSGLININAGTSVLVVYTSVLIEGTYTLSATLTTSDDLSTDDTNPTTP
ncbi:MAG: hypothetical protein Kow0098_05000 [Ignavibacteriaceae bacterium]